MSSTNPDSDPVRVRKLEDYDTSDEGAMRWLKERMRRQWSKPDESPLRLLGSMLAAVAVGDGVTGLRRGRVMQLADDFERNPESSALMQVIGGSIDISAHVEVDPA